MVNNITDVDRNEREQWMKSYKKKKMNKRMWVIALILVLIAGAAVYVYFKEKEDNVVGSGAAASKTGGTVKLKKFKSYEELLAFMKENESGASTNGGYKTLQRAATFATNEAMTDSGAAGWGAATGAPAAATDMAAGDEDAGSTDFSKTNVQVAGVDEDDIMKTDGTYIYAINGKNVVIFKALPADKTETVSTIELDYYPSGLYVSGDKLAVFGSSYDAKLLTDYRIIDENRNSNYADFRIYDVTDRTKPLLKKEYDFEGSFRDSRMIGDYVYFVTETAPVYAFYKTRPVPYMLEDGGITAVADVPAIYYFDAGYTEQNMTSVSAISLGNLDEEVKSEVYVLDGNQNTMYVSEKNIYITFSKYTSETQLMVEVITELMVGRLDASEREKIAEIEGVKRYILSDEEKASKIAEIFTGYVYSLDEAGQKQLESELAAEIKARYKEIAGKSQRTVVHKIAIEGSKLEYKSEGSVPGRVINQYAMDEGADGSFRIATTVNSIWLAFGDGRLDSYNNLFVLDGDMKQTGAVEDIGKGETIQSVRFLGDRAYMVTFKRTDPLFVISVADANDPKILGELKVPGYSTYLHPYGDNMLIGLGKNADDEGREIDGVKLSLFDATDVANPKEVDTYIMGEYGSSSNALYDAKAFLFSKDKNLLAIPATLKKVKGDYKYDSKVTASGVAIFKVTESGFEMRGVVDHRSEEEMKNEYASTEAQRSLYIGNDLYSLSNHFLKVTSLEDLVTEKTIQLRDDSEYAVPMAKDIGPVSASTSAPISDGYSTTVSAAMPMAAGE